MPEIQGSTQDNSEEIKPANPQQPSKNAIPEAEPKKVTSPQAGRSIWSPRAPTKDEGVQLLLKPKWAQL